MFARFEKVLKEFIEEEKKNMEKSSNKTKLVYQKMDLDKLIDYKNL